MNLKKLLRLTSLLIFISTGLFAQEQDYAEIMFLPCGTKANRDLVFRLYLNDNLIVSMKMKEILKYKIYSKGRINLTLIDNVRRYEGVLDIKENKTYYCVVGFPFKEYTNQLISESDGKEMLGKFAYAHGMELEEDKNKPIGKIPDNANAGGSKAGSGTGFLLNEKGYIITNFHVIDGAKTITVRGINGEYNTSLEASVVCLDHANDLAILKLNTTLVSFPTPPYSIQTSKEVKQGENVVALGYPIKDLMGNELKVTNGIISAKSGYKGSISQFQFSAAVQPGNSGGPLINSKGDIIGVVSSKINPQMAEAAGYAIKSDYLRFFLSLTVN